MVSGTNRSFLSWHAQSIGRLLISNELASSLSQPFVIVSWPYLSPATLPWADQAPAAWRAFCLLNTPNSFVPQGLCTCLSCENPSPWVFMLFLLNSQISSKTSPAQRGLPWPFHLNILSCLSLSVPLPSLIVFSALTTILVTIRF